MMKKISPNPSFSKRGIYKKVGRANKLIPLTSFTKRGGGIFFTIFFMALSFSFLCYAQKAKEERNSGIRIVISTSGPAKFNSYYLDEPPRLVVEFQSQNVVSYIDKEVTVHQGAIKKITSSYFGGDQNNSLKALSFELIRKLPYKIWQEANTILLDIETPKDLAVLNNGKEIFTRHETKDVIIKRLEAMESALKRKIVIQKTEEPNIPIKLSPIRQKNKRAGTSFVGTLVFGLGAMLLGIAILTYKLKVNFASKIKSGIRKIRDRFKEHSKMDVLNTEIVKLRLELKGKDKLLEQEDILRRVVEYTAISREKEFNQIKLELQKEKEFSEEEKKIRKSLEEELSQKDKEYIQIKESFENFKKEKSENELSAPQEQNCPTTSILEEKDERSISEESVEQRQAARLNLSRDYSRTIILRIEFQNKSPNMKSFVNNISVEGLCFETRREFNIGESLNLRLFFFGDNVPIMKIKAEIIWKKTVPPVNFYGVSFISLEGEGKEELNRYIESKTSLT